MEVLLAAVGPDDPWRPGPLAAVDTAGPVLSAAGAGRFRCVVLLVPAEERARAEACRRELRQRRLTEDVQVIPCPSWTALTGEGIEAAIRQAGTGAWFSAAGAGAAVLQFPSQPRVERLLIEYAAGFRSGYVVVRAVSRPFPWAGKPALLEAAGPGQRATSGRDRGRAVREPAGVYGRRAAPRDASADPAPPAAGEHSEEVSSAERRLGMVAAHPSMEGVRSIVEAVAPHRVPVLIQGDTGAGKGMTARLIHESADGSSRPFVAVNCGALPSTLIESHLFGHCRGSFTGASRDQPGKFVQAHGGTLFLDEIGELPVELQPKLLRVLEDGVVEPIGATRGTTVDVRVIAATNRDLVRAVHEGHFRKDLYYRLAFAVIRLPALRERGSDIAPLALHFMDRINRSLRSPRRLSVDALRRLERHPWPGNVRELENVIGRSALLCAETVLGPDDLVFDDAPAPREDGERLPEPHPGFRLDEYLTHVREALALRAMELAGGKQNQAARLLGLTPQGIHRILQSIARKTAEESPG